MKPIPVLTLTIIMTGLLVSAQEPTKEAKIDRILALMKADALADQVFEQMKAMTASMVPPDATEKQRAHAQELDAKVMDLVKARMSWDKMRPEYVRLYSETFADGEIDGMLAFYQSTAGRAVLEKMPLLVSKTMALAQSRMADIMPEIQRLVKEAMQK
jgi:uncharacterized protein